MNTYSRALRHIDMKDVKQKHRQKIVEEKIRQQEIEREKDYIQSVMKSEKYDWRTKLNEMMTSSDTFFTTLPATGDVVISTNDYNSDSVYLNNAVVSGSDVVMTTGYGSPTIVGGYFTSLRQVETGNIDATSSTHVTVEIIKPPAPVFNGTSFSSWQDRYPNLENFDDKIKVVMFSNSESLTNTIQLSDNLTTGKWTFSIPNNLRVKDLGIQFSQFAVLPLDPADDPDYKTPDVRIKVVTTQRKTPINVFVPLDSPEATSFIRSDPNLSNLSPQERQQKLKEMLEASDEYVMKILGSDFPGTGAVPPGEYDPFAQTPPGEAGDTPGVDIASLPPGPSGYKAPGTYDPKQFYDYSPPGVQPGQQPAGEFIPSPNLPMTGPGLSQADQDTQIAQNEPLRTMGLRPDGTHGYNKPGDKVYDPASGKTFEVKPGPDGRYQWMKVNVKSKDYQVAHYEPEGQLISEKRKLKSPEEILNRIPGYYPNKPAPLGFPVEQPPKMVNGMHPDLVNGKKVSDRFNRLDPESAKATPLTGNPHIDKKIKAARNKPK